MVFRKAAHVTFDQMSLSDEASEKNLLIQLADLRYPLTIGPSLKDSRDTSSRKDRGLQRESKRG